MKMKSKKYGLGGMEWGACIRTGVLAGDGPTYGRIARGDVCWGVGEAGITRDESDDDKVDGFNVDEQQLLKIYGMMKSEDHFCHHSKIQRRLSLLYKFATDQAEHCI